MKTISISVAALICFSSWVPVYAGPLLPGASVKWSRNQIKSSQTVPAGAKYRIVTENGSTFEGVTPTEFTFKNQKVASRDSFAIIAEVIGDALVTIEGYQGPSDLIVAYDFTSLNAAIPEFTWYSVDVSY